MNERFARRDLTRATSQLRAEKRGGKQVIVGYAAVFYKEGDPGTEFRLWSDMVERIMPGAFDAALREDDVRALFNHERNNLLGRRKPGDSSATLRLSVDDVGLLYEIDPPDTQVARDLLTSLERGDVDGSSFQFDVYTNYGAKRGDITWRETNGVTIREIRSLELLDVGPVVFPAYASTSSGVRSNDAELTRMRQEKQLALKRDTSADDEDELLLAAALARPLAS